MGTDPPAATTFGPAPDSGTPLSTGSDDDDDDDDEPEPVTSRGGDSTGWGDDTTTFGGDVTTTGSDDDSTGGDDGGPMGNCAPAGMCNAASSIGAVSGDQGSPSIGSSGTDPTWLRFLVREDDNSLVGSGLSFRATLVSPAGADFDLYVYRGVEGGSSGCNGFLQQSTATGSQDVVTMSWGEGLVPNGIDDSAWVAVEIRAKNDVCVPPQTWTLTVQGNV